MFLFLELSNRVRQIVVGQMSRVVVDPLARQTLFHRPPLFRVDYKEALNELLGVG